jgi:hypothetical protein
MLAKDPAERFESYDALIQAFHEALAALKADEEKRASTAPGDKWVFIAAILMVVISLMVATVVVVLVLVNRGKILRTEQLPPSKPISSSNAASGG